MKSWPVAVLIATALSGCLGYQIGPAKPRTLRDVQSIAVPTFKNSTLESRVEVLVAGTIIKQFQQDGTFRIRGDDEADAILKGEITRIVRSPARSVRGNVLATREFRLVVTVRYTLMGRNGQPLAGPSQVSGRTSFFVGSDIVTDERQALPLAIEELATRLVSQLSEGW